MVLWLVFFCLSSSWVNGLDMQQYRFAVRYFVLDLAILLVTVFILTMSLREYKFWAFTCIRPTRAALMPALAACVTFPVINAVARFANSFVAQAPNALADNLEQSVLSGDLTSSIVYYCVFCFWTPFWEEIFFRGFLLTSLTRYLPPAGAVLASSAVFTAVHCSVERFADLMLLGCVIGAVFVRTRNLAAPILVHSLWNLYVFLGLTFPGLLL